MAGVEADALLESLFSTNDRACLDKSSTSDVFGVSFSTGQAEHRVVEWVLSDDEPRIKIRISSLVQSLRWNLPRTMHPKKINLVLKTLLSNLEHKSDVRCHFIECLSWMCDVILQSTDMSNVIQMWMSNLMKEMNEMNGSNELKEIFRKAREWNTESSQPKDYLASLGNVHLVEKKLESLIGNVEKLGTMLSDIVELVRRLDPIEIDFLDDLFSFFALENSGLVSFIQAELCKEPKCVMKIASHSGLPLVIQKLLVDADVVELSQLITIPEADKTAIYELQIDTLKDRAKDRIFEMISGTQKAGCILLIERLAECLLICPLRYFGRLVVLNLLFASCAQDLHQEQNPTIFTEPIAQAFHELTELSVHSAYLQAKAAVVSTSLLYLS